MRPAPDIAGAWEGELVVKEVQGSSNIQVGQRRTLRGGMFAIDQDQNELKLRFGGSEIRGYFRPGETIASDIQGRRERMELDSAVLTSGGAGTLSRAELAYYGLGAGSLQGRLRVEIEQTSPTGARIVSGGMLTRAR